LNVVEKVEPSGAFAVRVTVLITVTEVVGIWNVTVFVPAGIVTVGGGFATPEVGVEVAERLITYPPVGARPLM